MAALLCAKDLCKTYVIDKRQNNVLKNVNLEVKEGGDGCNHGTIRLRKIHAFVCHLGDGPGNERSGAF